MSNPINVIICPKEELGFDSLSIREKYNSLSGVLSEHGFSLTRYLNSIDIAHGEMPDDHFALLKAALDEQGFILDTEKTVYAIGQ
jgi:hypothetical protein